MRSIFVAESPAEAHLVAGLLEEEGVRCIVEGEMLFGARGDLGLTPSTLPTVCVGDDDVARAVAIIRAVHPAEPAPIDEDAAPRKRLWRRVGTIAVLWTLAGVVAWAAGLGVALPIAMVCLFVHVYYEFSRA